MAAFDVTVTVGSGLRSSPVLARRTPCCVARASVATTAPRLPPRCSTLAAMSSRWALSCGRSASARAITFPAPDDHTAEIAERCDPPRRGRRRHGGIRAGVARVSVGLSAATEQGTVLLLLAGSDGAASLRQAVVDRARLVPNASPALVPRSDGGSLLGALILMDDGIALAEARFPADHAAKPTISLRLLGRVAPLGTPVWGAMLYGSLPPPAGSNDASGHAQRDSLHAVIGVADGTLLRLDADGSLAPATNEAPSVPPLVLVPAHQGAFVLCCDPLLGPFMAEALMSCRVLDIAFQRHLGDRHRQARYGEPHSARPSRLCLQPRDQRPQLASVDVAATRESSTPAAPDWLFGRWQRLSPTAAAADLANQGRPQRRRGAQNVVCASAFKNPLTNPANQPQEFRNFLSIGKSLINLCFNERRWGKMRPSART